MSTGIAVAIAVIFGWLGMVLAISFLEAPLKFRAPGVTTQIGLGIGRLVFRALNACESVFAIAVAAALFATGGGTGVDVAVTAAVAALVAQIVLVRPFLGRRTAAVLAGEDAPRSRAHHAYIALEAVKVVGLMTAGILLLGSA
ncbi:hypothetical protein LV457_18695 [Mycobacterium sp. MYCO198283]|uniref:hypothetical protein n=1 Tax=Mycobacterium sp. MYCO198283 TaxID=2883505 RepID=UPI001E64B49F|nr:hypothetical protein [Mycobacterium sp. MYCO198283]MCG5434304.1 hypothetical protein [Mycobacterium sp. MYCO198283]